MAQAQETAVEFTSARTVDRDLAIGILRTLVSGSAALSETNIVYVMCSLAAARCDERSRLRPEPAWPWGDCPDLPKHPDRCGCAKTSETSPTTPGLIPGSGPSDGQAGTANAAAPSPGGVPESRGANDQRGERALPEAMSKFRVHIEIGGVEHVWTIEQGMRIAGKIQAEVARVLATLESRASESSGGLPKESK